MDHNNEVNQLNLRNNLRLSSARTETSELVRVSNSLEDTFEESGYGSILDSTRDVTLSTDSPVYSSTPFSVTRFYSRLEIEASATPKRPPSTVHTVFTEDLIISLHVHDPSLLRIIFDYLEPCDLHHLVLAKRGWKSILQLHTNSRQRLALYRAELRARQENIPPLIAAGEVRDTAMDSARAVLGERRKLQNLTNIQPQNRQAVFPAAHLIDQPSSSPEVRTTAVPQPRRRLTESLATHNKKKSQKLSRLRLK